MPNYEPFDPDVDEEAPEGSPDDCDGANLVEDADDRASIFVQLTGEASDGA